jgi:alpha/beta superfamily hydrolase
MPFVPEREASIVVEGVAIPGGPYRLQGELAYPAAGSVRGAAILAGPHPLLGGNIQNNVLRALGDGLAARQWASLRFNYRGVGRSQGPAVDVAQHMAQFWQTSHVPDELDLWQDVQAAVSFLTTTVGPGLPVAIIGYSFGCVLLPRLRLERDRAALVLIAPTVARHDYDLYRSVETPTLVIASEDDFTLEAGMVQRWFDRLSMPRRLVQERLDNHFFRGHETWLLDTVFGFLQGLGR